MPRSEIMLGFVGSGKVEKRNAYALLRDLIDASGGHARFVLPLTKTYWNPALEVVSEFAKDNAVPVEAVVDESTARMRELKPLLAGCSKTHQSAAVAHKMAVLLEGARESSLLVLWNDEDEDALDVVRAVDEKGVTLLELTRGLDRIELVAADDDEEAPVPEQPAPDYEEPAPDVVIEEEEEVPEPEEEPEEEEAPVAEEALEEDDDTEVEEEEEFPEPEAADDLEVEDEDEEEFQAEDDEVFEPPAEEEDDAVVLEALEGPVGMCEFQQQIISILEGATATLVSALDIITSHPDLNRHEAVEHLQAAVKSTTAKPTAASPKATEAPAGSTTVKRVVKKTPAMAAAPAAAPSTNGTGKMTREQAEAIMADYRPRRGRPPTEVAQARKLLGLA